MTLDRDQLVQLERLRRQLEHAPQPDTDPRACRLCLAPLSEPQPDCLGPHDGPAGRMTPARRARHG